MKYCRNCGAQIVDEAVVCVHCGCATGTAPYNQQPPARTQTSSTLRLIAKIFMIIGCVLSGFYFLFPLCWTIPMTIHYCNAVKYNQPVNVGFKVCSLIFVSTVAGILMLCDTENN